MKHSIEQILKNLSIFLIVATLVVSITTLLTLEQGNLYTKINNLKNQKVIARELMNLNKEDMELASIQFNGKSKQLVYDIDKLMVLNKYDYTGQFIFNHSNAFIIDLNKLSELTLGFNNSAREYFEYKVKQDKDEEEEKQLKLQNSFYKINAHLNSMIFENISYLEEKDSLVGQISIFSFLLLFFATLWYKSRLSSVSNDIRYLFGVSGSESNYKVFSVEVDAIRLRMGRKQRVSDNPDMIDQVTQINNHKGMMTSYNNKKGLKENFVKSVTVFEIDNFSKQNRAYPQEFTQAVLKKIAFTISLHEQATDVVARTDYNQFTIILSRSTKEQAFKDIEIVRQSITELIFNIDNESPIITITGGFIVKPSNKPLEDALRQARDLLMNAKTKGASNTIIQTRDISKIDI